jgi:hypothetical protein
LNFCSLACLLLTPSSMISDHPTEDICLLIKARKVVTFRKNVPYNDRFLHLASHKVPQTCVEFRRWIGPRQEIDR